MTQSNRARGRLIPFPRRKMFWVTKIKKTFTNSLGGVADLMDDFRTRQGLLNNPPGLTIIRWIGQLGYRAVAVDDTIVTNLMGIMVADITNPPLANQLSGDPGVDWLLWSEQDYIQERQSGTPTQNLWHTKTFDIRSARKLEETEKTPYFVIESQDSDTQDYRFWLRMLVKLP